MTRPTRSPGTLLALSAVPTTIALIAVASWGYAERPRVVDVRPLPAAPPVLESPEELEPPESYSPASTAGSATEADSAEIAGEQPAENTLAQVDNPAAQVDQLDLDPLVPRPRAADAAAQPDAADDPLVAAGTIAGVGERRRLSLLINGDGFVYSIDPDATITLNGVPATLDQLGRGLRATVRLADVEPMIDAPPRVVAVDATTPRVGCGVSVGSLPVAFMGVGLDAGDDGVGVQVLRVIEGSPADVADLYIGDRILSVDDVAMNNSKQVVAAIRSHRPNQTVNVELLRDGDSVTLPVTLGTRPVRRDPYDGLGCGCQCAAAYRELTGVAPGPPTVAGVSNAELAARQQELLVQNRELAATLQQLRQEMVRLRAELNATSLR
ncbi:MAG: PDZ domain-containing protein [Planctomycetales bacterium]|nr:PDZ domain-containing protein [Planctomycetales bacterium]